MGKLNPAEFWASDKSTWLPELKTLTGHDYSRPLFDDVADPCLGNEVAFLHVVHNVDGLITALHSLKATQENVDFLMSVTKTAKKLLLTPQWPLACDHAVIIMSLIGDRLAEYPPLVPCDTIPLLHIPLIGSGGSFHDLFSVTASLVLNIFEFKTVFRDNRLHQIHFTESGATMQYAIAGQPTLSFPESDLPDLRINARLLLAYQEEAFKVITKAFDEATSPVAIPSLFGRFNLMDPIVYTHAENVVRLGIGLGLSTTDDLKHCRHILGILVSRVGEAREIMKKSSARPVDSEQPA